MKKLKLFLWLLSFCGALHGMKLTCESVGQYEISDAVVTNAAKTLEQFGGFNYLFETIKNTGKFAVDDIAAIKNIMGNSRYKLCCLLEDGERYHTRLYKKCDDGRYCLVGQSIFWHLKENNYLLEFLHTYAEERGKKIGTLLFLYTAHMVRQLADKIKDKFPVCSLSLRACPFEETGEKAQKRLNRFYVQRGCVLIDKKCNKFEWRDISLLPFDLLT